MSLHAWGWHPSYANEDRDRFDGLQLVQYPTNYSRAHVDDIAYIGSESDAREVAMRPGFWKAAILGDEWNLHSTAAEYNERYAESDRILRAAGVPTISAAIGMERLGTFDHEFVRGVKVGDIQGVNIMPTQYRTFQREAAKYPDLKWFVTLIPVRPTWVPIKHNTVLRWLFEVLTTDWSAQAVELHEDGRVFGVGVWCLKEGELAGGYWQSWHGMVSKHGRMTSVGRGAEKALKGMSE